MPEYKLRIVVEGEDKASGPLNRASSSLQRIGEFAAGGLITSGIEKMAGGIAATGQAVAGFLASSISDAKDLGAQLSAIGAVSQATAGEMAALKDLTFALGVDPKLKVSATDAAEAIGMLARNGLEVTEILDGAARSTVLLANSTGAEFGTAADIATDAMAIFGIQANEMASAVNGITSVVNGSKFDINDYRLALAQAGGVAGASGVEFDDFNTVIASIAPLFASGSDAGTSFKTMLQRLIPQSDGAAVLMRELGLFTGLTNKEYEKGKTLIAKYQKQLADLDPESKNYAKRSEELNQKISVLSSSVKVGQNAFFDMHGNLKDAASIAGLLNQALGDLSEEQRNNALSTIFGTDAMRAAAAMAAFTEEEFRNLKATMGNTDAEQSAAIRMDNLAGDMEVFRGVVETTRLQIGEQFEPALRTVFQTATTLLNDFNPAIVNFAGNVATALDGAVKRIANAKTQFDFLASSGNVVGGILAGLGTATGAVVDVPIGAKVVSVDWGGLQASFNNATKDLSITVADFVTGTFNLNDYTTTIQIGDFFTGTFSPADFGFSMAIGDFFTGTISLKDKIAQVTVGDFFAGTEVGTDGKIKFTLNETDFTFDLGALKTQIESQLGLIAGAITLGVTSIQGAYIEGGALGVLTKIASELATGVSALGEIEVTFDLSGVKDTIIAQLNLLKTGLLVGAIGLNFNSVTTKVKESIAAIPEKVKTALTTAEAFDFSGVASEIATKIQGIPNAITTSLGDLTEFTTIATTLQTGITALVGPDGALRTGLDFVLGIVDNFSTALADADVVTIGTTITSVSQGISQLLGEISGFKVETITNTVTTLSDFVTSITDFSTKLTETLDAEAMGEAFSQFAASFVTQFTAAIESLDLANIAASASALVAALAQSFRQAFSQDNTSLLGGAVGDLVHALLDQITAAFTSPDLGTDLGGAAADLAAGLFDAITGTLAGLGDALEGSGGLINLTEAAGDFVGHFLSGVAAAMANADYSAIAEALRGGIGGVMNTGLAVVGIDEESNRDRIREARQQLAEANAQLREAQQIKIDESTTKLDATLQVLNATASRQEASNKALFATFTEVIGGAVRDLGTLFTNPRELWTESFNNSARGSELDQRFGTSVVGLTGDTDIKANLDSASAAAKSFAESLAGLDSFTQTVLAAQAEIGKAVEQGPKTAEELGFNQEGFTQAQKAIEEFALATSQQAQFITSFSDVTSSVGDASGLSQSVDSLTAFVWPELPDLTTLTWPDLPEWLWPDYPAFEWPTLPEWTWPVLPIFSWPAFPAFTWPNIPRPTWRWPSIPKPGWLSTLERLWGSRPEWLSNSGSGSSGDPNQNATGTRNYRGGWTWVGEAGPELVNLPQGSAIYSAGESRQMVAAGAGGPAVVIQGPIHLHNGLDVQEFAYQVADIVQRRRGR